MRIVFSLALALAMTIAGCAPEPPPFEAVADVRQLMLTVVEPAAEVYWDSVGTIMTLDGTEEIAPSTTAEWEAVRNAAMVIAESGNLLLLPGRVAGHEQEAERWTKFSLDLIATGRQALVAAEARDPSAVFYAGGEVYLVCADCHAVFAPETLQPNFQQED